MSYPSGDIKLSANFELSINQPLDSRLIVTNYSDLNSITFKYSGMLVSVTSLNKIYRLSNDLNTWIEFTAVESTAGNGLTLTGRAIELGGILSKNTNINLNNKIFSLLNGSDTIINFLSGRTYSQNIISLDWNNRVLLDNTSGISIDWLNKKLKNKGNDVVSWNDSHLKIFYTPSAINDVIDKQYVDNKLNTLFNVNILKSTSFPALIGDVSTSSGSLNTIVNWSNGNTTNDIRYEKLTNKGIANGYVPLNGSVKIDSVYLPATSSGIYAGASPSTISVGGIPSGYVLTGKTYDQILSQMLVVYQSPAFSAFSANFSSNPLEVGITIPTSRTFTWSTTNSGNVGTNTISIIDVTNSNTVLASSLANDGSELITIGTVTNIIPISQQYKIQATNTNSILFNTTYTLTSKYPCFFGKVASGGAGAGVNRPIANQSLINSGTKMSLSTNENGAIVINFNSTSDDYLWFAVPYTGSTKTTWFVSSLNNGAIGGSVSSGGNLFPAPDIVNINEPTVTLWNGISYKIYISNYQSGISSNMTLS